MAPTSAQPEQRSLLVFGSSVAEGYCAEACYGWTSMMRDALESRGVQTRNCAQAGTNVEFWRTAFDKDGATNQICEFDIVVLALSLANEGLAGLSKQQEIDALADAYLEGYYSLVRTIRKNMVKPGARLIVGCPYPNDNYNEAHLTALERVRSAISSWTEVDYAIDFLASFVHAGAGRWCEGLAADPGHPNDEGHAQMFACVDLDKVLGTAIVHE